MLVAVEGRDSRGDISEAIGSSGEEGSDCEDTAWLECPFGDVDIDDELLEELCGTLPPAQVQLHAPIDLDIETISSSEDDPTHASAAERPVHINPHQGAIDKAKELAKAGTVDHMGHKKLKPKKTKPGKGESRKTEVKRFRLKGKTRFRLKGKTTVSTAPTMKRPAAESKPVALPTTLNKRPAAGSSLPPSSLSSSAKSALTTKALSEVFPSASPSFKLLSAHSGEVDEWPDAEHVKVRISYDARQGGKNMMELKHKGLGVVCLTASMFGGYEKCGSLIYWFRDLFLKGFSKDQIRKLQGGIL